MTFYRFLFDEKYKFLTTKTDEDIRFIRKKLSTATIITEGEHIIELIESDSSDLSTKEFADFPGFYSGGILATLNAKILIEKNLSSCGQWIPMLFRGKTLYYFNTICVEDVVDFDKSEFSTYDGYITDIKCFKFKNIEHPIPMLFKIKGHVTYPPIVTQEFVDMIKSSGLNGLIFKQF
jgi:hypothetical protein